MIKQYEPRSHFMEWASNLSEGLYMIARVYGDESGTHDDADVVILSGLMQSPEYWDKFNLKWRAVLDNYGAKYFHYREFRADANTQPGDPYYGWSAEKRRHFVFKLALLVGDSAVPSGGAYAKERNAELGLKKVPFEETIRSFFESTIAMLNLHWRNQIEKVLFIFDDCKNRKWTGPIHKIHAEYKEKYPLIGGMAFEDDKDNKHLGLQAADLSTMLFRNGVRQYVETEGEHIDVGILDFIVTKNQDVMFRNLPAKKTQKLIDDMRGHEAWVRKKGFKGAYHPLKHFPFKQYGYQK
jgi:hypothetical protein